MNHRPRRPGDGPSRQMPPNRGRPPAMPPAQQPGPNGFIPPQPPQQQFNGRPPPQMPNAPGRPNGPHMNGAPRPQARNQTQNQAQSRMAPPKYLNEEFSIPVRQNKPIPASVPPLDVDAIAQALSQCARELDGLESNGRIYTPPPESIDDLVVVDMYTPREQIPASRRNQAAQAVALQGPAEEGAGIRQHDLIQALKLPGNQPGNILDRQPAGRAGNVDGNQPLPEPKLFDREPELRPKPRKKAENINPMLEAFEAAIFADSPQHHLKASDGLSGDGAREPDLSQEEFGSRLMPKDDAYRIKRDGSINPKGTDDGMSLEELHSYYASLKGGPTPEEIAEREALLNARSNNQGFSGGGFLSGLGGSEPSHDHSGFATSGGFLSGVSSGGTDQLGAFASRYNVSPADMNSQPSGASFLDSLNAFNQPITNSVPHAGLPEEAPYRPSHNLAPVHHQEPGYGSVWDSSSVSPAAKAYRDAVLFGGNPAQQARSMPPHGRQQPPPVQRPISGPSFLRKPSPASVMDDDEDMRGSSRKRKAAKRRKQRLSPRDRSRRRAIQAYFGDRPAWSLATAFTGLAMVASQSKYDRLREWVLMEPSWILLAGIVLFVLSVTWRLISSRKPKEETLDDWIAEDLVRLEKHAFEAMKLNNRYLLLEPIVMSGFPDIENIHDEFVNGLYGKDHILRYTPRALTVMCFTREEVLTYEGAVDLTTGEIVYENAREFFYADIATIGMVKTKVRRRWRVISLFLPWRWFFVGMFIRNLSGRSLDRAASRQKEMFQISLKDGTRIQLILRDARVMKEQTYEELPLSTDEKVLKAITDFVAAQKTDQLAGYR